MLSALGVQSWWPADTPFEVAVGALLTQQTRWGNVEQAISNIRAKNLLEPDRLAGADTEMLEGLIRCTGFYRQKARRLKKLAQYFSRHKNVIFDMPVEVLRKNLLELEGVGEETADSIILYAAGKPKFVIDAYTRRILGCLGIRGSYRELQHMFESQLRPDVELFKEYHALIVEYGKGYCGTEKCEGCILVLHTDKNRKNGKTLI